MFLIKIWNIEILLCFYILCYNDFIFQHLLILTCKSIFKGLGRVTENFVLICKRQPNYFENFFFIYNILMKYLSLIIINFQNVLFYLYNFLFHEGQKNTLYLETHFHKKTSNLNIYRTWIQYFRQMIAVNHRILY